MKYLLLLFSLTTPFSAYAQCVINGEIYPEEAVVNGYKCVDGDWVEE